MTSILSRATAPAAVLGASAPPNPGMLHLGIGNFHRAHAAVYTAKAMAGMLSLDDGRLGPGPVVFIDTNGPREAPA